MFKRILVPTDGSEFSRRALIEALALARLCGAEVELLHVTNLSQYFTAYPGVYAMGLSQEQIEAGGKAALEEAVSGLDLSGIKIVKKHLEGYPASVILDEIHRDFDLVVMGSHGRGAFSGAVLGSVSLRVVTHAACPVMIVK